MCRMLGYLGPALSLAEALSRPSHSLVVGFRELPAGFRCAGGSA